MSALHKAVDGILRKIHRSPLYYRKYNTTLDFRVNRKYIRYAEECAARYAAEHPGVTFPVSPLVNQQPAVMVKKAITPELAHKLSDKITQLIDSGDPCAWRNPKFPKKQIIIHYPLESVGEELFEAVRNPEVEKILTTFFKGHYGIVSAMGLRSLPTDDAPAGSWLWHSDTLPSPMLKLFLHLTPANPDRGVTDFMNCEDTMAYRAAGYFGQFREERRGDLDVFAKEHGLPYRPFHLDAEPGDATIFCQNYFHRAVSPKVDYRDVVELSFIPSPIPWEEHYRQHKAYVRKPPSGFPKDPRKLEVATGDGVAMAM